MLSFIVLALVVVAVYLLYKWVKTGAAEVEQDAQAVEAAVQTDVATAEKVAEGVVSEVKAKL